MKRRGGWTLIELLVVTTVMGTFGATILSVASTVHQEERLAHACATDLSGLRRAALLLEQDLRVLAPGAAPAWSLVDGVLHRGDVRVAKNIATFDVAWDGDLARVTLVLGPRSDSPHRREARLAFAVRSRTPNGTAPPEATDAR